MKVQVSRTKSSETFYVAKTYRDPDTKRSTSRIVRRLGTRAELEATLPKGTDVMQWAKAQAREMTEAEREMTGKVTVSYDPTRPIEPGARTAFNVGYLFLKAAYHELRLPEACARAASGRRFDFDLDEILSRLVWCRVIEPGSKRATCEFASELAEPHSFSRHQVYRALSALAEASGDIQAACYRASEALRHRRTGVLYYDCTNYYFEITEEDGFRMYGPSKEHRPSPIVGMGLMMDADGLPLAFDLYPGNQSEQPTLTPLEERIRDDMGISRFVVCTDAGLASAANRRYNSQGELQFVTTVSLRSQKAAIKAWARDTRGWSALGRDGELDLDEVRARADDPDCPAEERRRLYATTFYKTMFCGLDDGEGGEFEQTLIATYSLKYRDFQRGIREQQVERARRACEDGTARRHRKGPKDPMRFVASTSVTGEGEVAETTVLSVDEAKVAEEASWDGLYGLATSLDERDSAGVVRVAAGRWEVEECFRIMKTEFEARPVYLSRRDRIEAHFLTCFLALLLYRIVERRLGGRFTCPEIVAKLREMRMERVPGEGWRPLYVRDDLTDALHEAFGFRTDYEIVPDRAMKRIFRQTASGASITTREGAGGNTK